MNRHWNKWIMSNITQKQQKTYWKLRNSMNSNPKFEVFCPVAPQDDELDKNFFPRFVPRKKIVTFSGRSKLLGKN